MDEFEQRSREAARAILERHGWKRPMTAELKEMRGVVDLPYSECKRYLVEEWQNMRVPLLEKENAELRELVRDMVLNMGGCALHGNPLRLREFGNRAKELGVEV